MRGGGTTYGYGSGRSAGLIAVLTDKATLAGITVHPVNERDTSSTCPTYRRKISKPRGRVFDLQPLRNIRAP
jgi:hypothetical protein